MLEVLNQYAPLPTDQLTALVHNLFLNIKHVSLLRWLASVVPGVEIPNFMINSAVNRGDLAMLEFLLAHGLTTCTPSAFDSALTSRRLDVLEFLLEHYSSSLDEFHATMLAWCPDADVQQVLATFSELFQEACTTLLSQDQYDSRLDHIKNWAACGLISPQWPISIDTTAANGNIEIVRFLNDHGIATATTEAMDQAAESGHWELVAFLHHHRSEGCTTRTLDAAIQQDRLDQVMFFHTNRSEGCSPDAAEKTLHHQSICTVRYLHLHKIAAFSAVLIDMAAACGNLALVEFLHENRSEGCTTDAMDDAAANGHLHVVEFLHDHRQEGLHYRALFDLDAFNEALIAEAVRFALRLSRHEAVQFLFDHFPHLFARDLLSDLLVHGAFDIYTKLQSENPDDANDVISTALYEAGRLMELPTIRYVVDVLGRRDLASRAMDGAASISACGNHWVRAVVTGPKSCRFSAVHSAIGSLVTAAPIRFSSRLLDTLKFLIRQCCEPGAKRAALEDAETRRRDHRETQYAGPRSPRDRSRFIRPTLTAIVDALRNWDVAAEQDQNDASNTLHPFLLDPRVKTWTIVRLFNCSPDDYEPYRHMLAPQTWALLAAYRHDLSLLEVIHETAPTAWYTHANHGDVTGTVKAADLLSFEGAREAAIRVGDLEILKWLIVNVDLPLEPSLLEEALLYRQHEIAQWLTKHYGNTLVHR